MRIIIATGIFPPEVGGPALYAKGVKEALEAEGHEAPAILFGGLRKYPSGLRHLLYAFKLFRASRGADAIFAFDSYSVGVPAAFVGMLLHVPVVVRIGGDFVWESYVERTKQRISLSHFYRETRALSLKEYVARVLIGWMLHHAELAFNTRWLLEIWREPYGISDVHGHIVGNVIGPRLPSGGSDGTVLLYGRQIALKNAEAFRRAFEKANTSLSLEEGSVPHEQFLERIRRAHAVALPSVSEVAPNAVIDAIRCGKPFLLTTYSGYAETFKELGVIVDPLDEEDMARGVRELADPEKYAYLCSRIAKFQAVRTYTDVAHEMLSLVKKV